MTDSDPFASFFEKKDKKAKGKKVKNVVTTDELESKLHRAAIREQKANQPLQIVDSVSTYTTAVEMLDDDDEFASNAAVADMNEDDVERKFERTISTTAANKSNPWGISAVAATAAAADSDNNVADSMKADVVQLSETKPVIENPVHSVPPSSSSPSASEIKPAPASNSDKNLALPTSSADPAAVAADSGEAQKPKPAAYVPRRVLEANAASGPGNTALVRAEQSGTSAPYRPPFRGDSSDVRNAGPLSGAPGGAYKPPGSRGDDAGAAPKFYRRTVAPNIQSKDDFPTLG